MRFFDMEDFTLGDILAIAVGVVIAEIIIQMLVTPTIQKRPTAATTPQPAGAMWG